MAIGRVVILALAMVLPLARGIDLERGEASAKATPWVRKIDDGLRRRASVIVGPKVVIVGGSNVLFGFDAPSMSEAIGCPVIAYGLHAGIGIDVIAERASGIVRLGDIVVYCPELPNFKHEFGVNYALRSDIAALFESDVDRSIGRPPVRTWHVARERLGNDLRAASQSWSLPLSRLATGRWGEPVDAVPLRPYSLEAIDEGGNLVFPRPNRARQLEAWKRHEIDPAAYDLDGSAGTTGLRVLDEVCREIGATLIVQPGVRLVNDDQSVPAEQGEIIARENDWVEVAAAMGRPRLLAPGENVLPMAFAYDSDWHLNDAGVALMQDRFVDALRPYLRR